MSIFIPIKRYEYQTKIKSGEEFFSILNTEFNIGDSSGVLIRNSDKPFEFTIKGDAFEAERNVRYMGGNRGPVILGEFDSKTGNLLLTIKYEKFRVFSFIGLIVILFMVCLYGDMSLVRTVFSLAVFSSIIYGLALISFHINEERFPVNFDKRFRKYILSKKVVK